MPRYSGGVGASSLGSQSGQTVPGKPVREIVGQTGRSNCRSGSEPGFSCKSWVHGIFYPSYSGARSRHRQGKAQEGHCCRDKCVKILRLCSRDANPARPQGVCTWAPITSESDKRYAGPHCEPRAQGQSAERNPPAAFALFLTGDTGRLQC